MFIRFIFHLWFLFYQRNKNTQTTRSLSCRPALCLQDVLASKRDGDSQVLGLRTQGEVLQEQLEEREAAQLALMVQDAEQQWGSVLQGASQAEHRALLDDFDAQSQSTQLWVKERQLELQSVGSHTPPEDKRHTAQVRCVSQHDPRLKWTSCLFPALCVYNGHHFGQVL